MRLRARTSSTARSARSARAAALAVLLGAPWSPARDVRVTSTAELSSAVAAAQPGDVITLADGTYPLSAKLSCAAAGSAGQPIVLRGETRLGATLVSTTLVAIGVSGPHWRFEDFAMRGACASDSDCEHALQVTGGATDVVLRRLRLVDFNAQLKVNAAPAGDGGFLMPHRGLVEGCELSDTRPRSTANPVTKLNIDTGDDFVVRDTVIRDFSKSGGNLTSYGAFMKSGGKRGRFERNLVICRSGGQAMTDVRIGLSFGGGGTAPQFCAPAFDAGAPCSVEHEDGVLRNNVIVNCSDVGIYLNRAKNTAVLHNTLIGTSGVDFRFPTTSGRAVGNLLGSAVRARDAATFTATQNVSGVTLATFEAAYVAPLEGDLRVAGDVSPWLGQVTPDPGLSDDLCGRARTPPAWTAGALEHALGDCAPPAPDAGSGAPADAGSVPPVDGGAGAAGDGGQPPGNPTPDAGPEAPGPPQGCGCASGEWAGAVLAGALLRRRRPV